jgi:excisionase family DNA binding protein
VYYGTTLFLSHYRTTIEILAIKSKTGGFEKGRRSSTLLGIDPLVAKLDNFSILDQDPEGGSNLIHNMYRPPKKIRAKIQIRLGMNIYLLRREMAASATGNKHELSNLSLEDIEANTPIIGIQNIAKRCGVTKKRVDEWIESKRFPAYYIGGEFRIRTEDLNNWITNGFRPPARVIFEREISIDILSVFAEYEVGKNCMPPTSFRIPLAWKPLMENLFRVFPQFENKYSNFVRCSIWNLLLELNELADRGGADSDPCLRVMDNAARLKNKAEKYTLAINNLKANLEIIKKSSTIKILKEFLKDNTPEVARWEAPWKSRGERILKEVNRILENLLRKKQANEDDFIDVEEDEDHDETGFDITDDHL